jgi:hypothetical protein
MPRNIDKKAFIRDAQNMGPTGLANKYRMSNGNVYALLSKLGITAKAKKEIVIDADLYNQWMR